jgi:hypothetical protein
MPGHGIIPFFMDDSCHILPFAFIRLQYIAVIEWSIMTKRPAANRYLIADILSLTSVEMVFNRLSNVCLTGIVTRSQYF